MRKFFKKLKSKFSVYFITGSKKERKQKRTLSKKERIIKYTTIILFPVLAITSGVILGFRDYNNKNHKVEDVLVVTTSGVKRKIFLVSSDNYTIPLTVTMEQRTTLQQEIVDVFDMLKTTSKANSTYVSGFINENTKLKSFNLENKVLELNMSEEFFQTEFNNVNVIEALTLTFLQFEEIEEIKLFVEGQEVNYYNQIPLPSSLDYSFGINNEIASIKDMRNKEKVVVFGKRQYDKETSYLVPVTLYCDKGESDNITFVNGIKRKFRSDSLLKQVSLYQGIENMQEANEDFILKVNSTSLTDENYVSKDLFDLVNMSLELMGKDQLVSFNLEGESVQVDGVYELEDYSVSSTVINEVKL